MGRWDAAVAALPDDDDPSLPIEPVSFAAVAAIEIDDIDRARSLAERARRDQAVDQIHHRDR